MQPATRQTDYGTFPIGREDIRGKACCTIDLRRETGGWAWRDHQGSDVEHPAGHPFQLSVFSLPDGDGMLPVAEVLVVLNDSPVSLVGHPTGRPGVVELTPDHLRAALGDDGYRQILLGYVGGAA